MTYPAAPAPLGLGTHADARVDTLAARGWGLCWLALVALACAASGVVGFTGAVVGLTLAAFASMAAAAWQPALALTGAAALCVLSPFLSTVLTGEWLRWNTINYVLIAATVLNWRLLFAPDPLLRVALALVALLALEVLLSPDVVRGTQDVLAVAALFGLRVFYERATEPADWLWAGVVGGALGAAVGTAYLLEAGTVPEINPNVWSYGPIAALFGIALALPFARAGWAWPTLLGLAAPNLMLVFLSASRGSMLVALVWMLYVWTAARGAGRRALLLAGVALVAVAASSAAFAGRDAYAVGRLLQLTDTRRSLARRTSGRSELTRAGLLMAREHPLGGVGTGGFAATWVTLGARDGLSGWERGQVRVAHAGWVKVLAENGVPGAALLAVLVGGFVVRGATAGPAAPADRHARLRFGAFVALALALAFVSTEYQSKGVWLLAAGALTLLRRAHPAARYAFEAP